MSHKITFLLGLMACISSTSVNAAGKSFTSGERKVVLVELYTSEGCSSCPPAEKWMNTLKDNPRLWKDFIPLSFHVDYWDYIGWKDPFADPRYSLRQQTHSRLGNLSTVYTPGMMLDGREWRGWYSSGNIRPSTDAPGTLNVSVDDNRVTAMFTASKGDVGRNNDENLVLNIAVLGFDLESEVNAGENAGRLLKQEFVVLGLAMQESNNGKWQIDLPQVNPSNAMRTGLAAWVSERGNLVPIQATGGLL